MIFEGKSMKRDNGGEKKKRRRGSEIGREKIELNWGQIDSSRESLHSIWRLPNRVRLTPFKTFTRRGTVSRKYLRACALNEVKATQFTKR